MGKYIKTSKDFLNEGVVIDGLEYPISERNYEYLVNGGWPKFIYTNNNPENFHDKSHIRVYNHKTKEHYYLENVVVKPGDSNLLFVDFPRTDAPTDSWSSDASQHANIRCWNRNDLPKWDFVRYKILSINDNGMCWVDDGYNEPSGWYARDCFYKINKIMKGN